MTVGSRPTASLGHLIMGERCCVLDLRRNLTGASRLSPCFDEEQLFPFSLRLNCWTLHDANVPRVPLYCQLAGEYRNGGGRLLPEVEKLGEIV